MSTQDEQLQRWAADHLATLTTRGPSIARNRPTVPLSPMPVVLASVTETRTWHTESRPLGVSLHVPPDGRARLAVGEESGVARIWDPETGDLLHTLTGHTDAVLSIGWGRDNGGRPLLATRGNDGTVRIWNPESGELAHPDPIPTGRTGFGDAVSWGYAPDGRALLAIGTSNGTRIWDAETGDAVDANPEVEDDKPIYTVSWGCGHDGELLLASAGDGRTVRIFDLDSGQTLQVDTGHTQAVRAVAWVRPDGEALRFVTVGIGSSAGIDNATLCQWREGPDGQFTAETVDLRQGGLRMVSAVPLPDGRALLVGNSEQSLFVLDGNTLDMLHAQRLDFRERGLHNLDWAVMPDGSLMVCASSHPDHVHVWNITLDPPIGINTPQRPGALVIPPEDVTPRFQAEAVATTNSVSCALRADGEVIAATWHNGGQARIWAVSTGSLLHTIPLGPGPIQRLAFGNMPDGRLVLAIASGDGPDIQLWDPATGELVVTRVHQPTSPRADRVDSVAWIHDRDGRPLLASGGLIDGTVLVQDPESGVTVRALAGHGQFIHAIAEGRLADGRPGLVTCDGQAAARVWDIDTGELLTELTVPGADADANQMWTAAWGRGPDGRPVIAVSSDDGTVRIFDAVTGEVLLTLIEHDRAAYSLIWWDRPGWPSILVSGSHDGVVRIWDPATGAEQARLRAGGGGFLHALDLALTRDGDLLLVAPAEQQEAGPLRVWRIAVGPTEIDGAGPAEYDRTYLTAELAELLLRLGGGGLWLPLGLLADLVTLTSPATESTGLCDARLAALTDEPGIGRLRDLAADQPGWNHIARAAFAALLTADLDIPEHFTPPPDTDRPALRHALANTTTAGSRHWPAPAAGLRQAATAITDQTITLLRILGPAACAADPLLPLRLAHHAHQLPALTKHELQLLAPATQPAANGQTTATGTLVYSPGTTGLTRSGPLTRLLPTQLALPQDLLTVRLAENQLLYRQHRAPTPPAPEPVTMILDTTPPTFGPAGHVLRLAAHLITTTLWHHGRYPRLITLTAPGILTDLRTPADLISIWTSVTLDDPLPALTTARHTAVAHGHPVVFFTHQHTAPASYTPSQATRLLTTHQPPEQALQPSGPWHLHLPPTPTRDQLTTAITGLVMPRAEHAASAP